ncbi:hypothetical protein [Mesorhizobium sp.]|uniref:hypothetical protein n=1 Tax=Mesorhizobium sp. TaxID=1871066 RepID=UPI0025E5E577|nr:hypothetical protein [Mesorhizobium sp.]
MAAEAVANAMTDANRMFFMDLPGFERTYINPGNRPTVPASREVQPRVTVQAGRFAEQQKAALVARRGFVD